MKQLFLNLLAQSPFMPTNDDDDGDGDGVAQDSGYTLANRLTETCTLGLQRPSLILDIR